MTNFSERQKKQGALVRAYKLNGDEKAAHELFLSMKPFFEMRAKRMSDDPTFQQDFFSAYCEAFSYCLQKADVDRAETFSGLVQLSMKEYHKKVIMHRNSPATGSVKTRGCGTRASDSEFEFATLIGESSNHFENIESKTVLAKLIDECMLNDKEKFIISMLLTDDKMSHEKIGKAYGITRQSVSVVYNRALDKIKAHFKSKGLEFSDLL